MAKKLGGTSCAAAKAFAASLLGRLPGNEPHLRSSERTDTARETGAVNFGDRFHFFENKSCARAPRIPEADALRRSSVVFAFDTAKGGGQFGVTSGDGMAHFLVVRTHSLLLAW